MTKLEQLRLLVTIFTGFALFGIVAAIARAIAWNDPTSDAGALLPIGIAWTAMGLLTRYQARRAVARAVEREQRNKAGATQAPEGD